MFKVVLSLMAAASLAHADGKRFVSLTAELNVFKTLLLTSEETVEFLPNSITHGSAFVVRDGHTYLSSEAQFLQGPCEVRFRGEYKERAGICTFIVHRNTQPPDKTMVIPQGGSASIVLQCSSNLVDWVTANNGIYTNVPSMKFFRIYSEKLP